MADTVKETKVIELDDFNFYVVFLFEGNALKTESLKRSSSTGDVESAIRASIDLWVGARDDDNYKDILTDWDGKKSVVIT